jgi:hypothetical protein
MEARAWRDGAKGERYLMVSFTDRDLIDAQLDAFDRAVLATPETSVADMLQSAQLIAFRLEQRNARALLEGK